MKNTPFDLISDCHLDFYDDMEPLKDLYLRKETDLLVIAGDLAEIRNYEWFDGLRFATDNWKDVVYVWGNHGRYATSIERENISKEMMGTLSNLHFLDNEVKEVQGIRFAGSTLWFPGGYDVVLSTRVNDFTQIPQFFKRLPVWQKEAKEFISGLKKGEVDVLVTHHAPSYMSVGSDYIGSPLNCFYVNPIEEEIFRISPQYVVHGHIHSRSNYNIGSTIVLAEPAGYPRECVH